MHVLVIAKQKWCGHIMIIIDQRGNGTGLGWEGLLCENLLIW